MADQDEVASALSKEEGYQIIEANTARLLGEVAGMNIEVKEGEKKVNMCKAFQDMTDKAMEKGRAAGHVEGHAEGRAEETVRLCREFGQSEEAILNRLMNELNLTEEQALQYMK